MEELLERARTYLDSLEADRQAALSLSEQKAEEAKLIKARQEGFRKALEIFGEHDSTANIHSPDHSKELGERRAPNTWPGLRRGALRTNRRTFA